MAMSKGARIGLVVGVLGGLVGITCGLLPLYFLYRQTAPRAPFQVRLDRTGPYVILATTRADKSYPAAIDVAQQLHLDAQRIAFDPDNLSPLQESLRSIQPRYALVFIEPEELDVNFAWRWLTMTTQLDEDPLVDVRTGFITGATPEAAVGFVSRIADAVAGHIHPPGALLDNLGPMVHGNPQDYNRVQFSAFLPVWGLRSRLQSILHGKGGFPEHRLPDLADAGVIHFGGHGHPDRIDDGLVGCQLPSVRLAPCIVFNGACYTGVTHRWYDGIGGTWVGKQVDAKDSFCLNMLNNNVLAYLAPLHPDHGIPVYQEMEFLAGQGGSLGDAIKYTHDGVVLGNGGTLPVFELLQDGIVQPVWSPAEIMLKGTASRILFGDPAMVVCDPFAVPAWRTETTEVDGDLRIVATLVNPEMKNKLTDTYHNDLNRQAPFNDRALVQIVLPDGWFGVERVEEVGVNGDAKVIAHRLVGYAVEVDQGIRRLHVQIDVPAQGFQQSALRIPGATVELRVLRGE